MEDKTLTFQQYCVQQMVNYHKRDRQAIAVLEAAYPFYVKKQDKQWKALADLDKQRWVG